MSSNLALSFDLPLAASGRWLLAATLWLPGAAWAQEAPSERPGPVVSTEEVAAAESAPAEDAAADEPAAGDSGDASAAEAQEPTRAPPAAGTAAAPPQAGASGSDGDATDAADATQPSTSEPLITLVDPPEGHTSLGMGVAGRFHVSFDGKLRVRYSTFFAGRFFGIRTGEGSPYVGNNDGFAFDDARLNLRASYGNLFVRLGFDGAGANFTEGDPLGSLTTIFKDAYFRYAPVEWAQISVGRFKPPWETEALTATEDQLFVHRALESRGVQWWEGSGGGTPGHGGDTPGFNPGRQLGIMVGTPDLKLFESVPLGYAVAVTNGNSGVALNDNDLPALFMRLDGGYRFGAASRPSGVTDDEGPATRRQEDGIYAGFSFMLNQLTMGEPPNRQHDTIWGVAADVTFRGWGVIVQGQIISTHTDHETFQTAGGEGALGAHVQFGYEIPGSGLTPAYRFAAYDPRMPDAAEAVTMDDELVMHHTIAVRWQVPDLPLIVWAEYTVSLESGSRAIPNDRFELAAQVTFD